jgi:FkbM family methyltransferase
MNGLPSVSAGSVHWAAILFRYCFRGWRPRGYMRLGQLVARIFPQARYVPISFVGGPLWVDLASIDHQPMFLDDDYLYEPHERRLLSTLLVPGEVAIDVGANAGAFARIMAQAVGEAGFVVAYEPKPELLIHNSRQLRQLVVRPFGVSDQDSTALFREERAGTMSHFVPETERRHTDLEVKMVSLDADIARLRLARVDFLKVDVEGLEDAVFRGAELLLTVHKPPVIMFEWNPTFRGRCKESALDLLSQILNPGWSIYHLKSDGSVAVANGWAEPEDAVTVIGIPTERLEVLKRFQGQIHS